VFLDEGEEVLRGVAGEGGLGEVRVGGEEVFCAGVEVGEVAAPAAGDEDFLAGGVAMFEHSDTTAAAAGMDGAHESGGACAKDEYVDLGHVRSSNNLACMRFSCLDTAQPDRFPLGDKMRIMRRMKVPAGIKLTSCLMGVVVVLHLAAIIASDLPYRWNEGSGLARFVLTSFGVAAAGVVLCVVQSLVVWFYWRGRSWARWVVVAGCLLAFVSLRHFVFGPPVSHGRMLIIGYRTVVAVVVLVYLCTGEARAWFARYSRERGVPAV
jgi:hypothetical protein